MIVARFDVYYYPGKGVDLVLDVQSNLLSELNTCVVIPLVSTSLAKEEYLVQLKPVIEIDDENYLLMTTDLAALPRNSLSTWITNIERGYRQEIIDAIDFLFQGF